MAAAEQERHPIVRKVLNVMIGLMALSVILSFLFTGGMGKGGSDSFGNLYVNSSWKARGILPAKVEHFVVFTEFPISQSHDSSGRWKIRFRNEKELELVAAEDELLWIDPNAEVRRVKLSISKNLLDKIDARRASAASVKFESPEQFLQFVNDSGQ